MQDLIDLAITQEYKCAISGEILFFEAGAKRQSLASVDRIDPSLGYIKSNIQLLTFQVNWMKSNLSMLDLYTACENTLKSRDKLCLKTPEIIP